MTQDLDRNWANVDPNSTPIDEKTEPLVRGEQVLPLHVEELAVTRRTIERSVRVHVQTINREHLVDEGLTQERVEIKRIAVGRPIDVMPPVREEGDTTIIPVVEEVLVVERRLILKEEVHLRRIRSTVQHRETVTLREQHVVVERAELGASLSVLPSDLAPIPKPQTPRE